MVQIITIMQEKGGVGKTTLSCCLAGSLDQYGLQVLILDTDPQKNASIWVSKEGTSKTLTILEHLNEATFFDVIDQVRDQFDIIIIDTAGYKSAIAQYAIQASDVLFVPTVAEEFSVTGAIRTLKHIKDSSRAMANPPTPYMVITNFDNKTKVQIEIFEYLKSENIPLIKTPIHGRTGFKEILTRGGIPKTGSAAIALKSFIADLQMNNIIKFDKK